MHLGHIKPAIAGDAKTRLQTGLIAGTSILTLDGVLPVEHLAPGDRVVTRDSGMAILKAVRVRKTTARMVRIKAGTLGTTRPEGDVVLPADQGILIRDWRAKAIYGEDQAIVPAEQLIDGEFISEHSPAAQVTLFELQFESPHIVYADGLELSVSESVLA
ncbi:MAG: Hint domain-containing protein [Pseudomonadota bacterium]